MKGGVYRMLTFVEKMLSKYSAVYKRITLPVQQFIVFTIIIKSVEKL